MHGEWKGGHSFSECLPPMHKQLYMPKTKMRENCSKFVTIFSRISGNTSKRPESVYIATQCSDEVQMQQPHPHWVHWQQAATTMIPQLPQLNRLLKYSHINSGVDFASVANKTSGAWVGQALNLVNETIFIMNICWHSTMLPSERWIVLVERHASKMYNCHCEKRAFNNACVKWKIKCHRIMYVNRQAIPNIRSSMAKPTTCYDCFSRASLMNAIGWLART